MPAGGCGTPGHCLFVTSALSSSYEWKTNSVELNVRKRSKNVKVDHLHDLRHANNASSVSTLTLEYP